MDFQLDNTGDLALSGGDLVVTHETTDEIAQHVRVRLRMFKGEWFLNLDEGTPYYDEILEKGVDDGRVGNIIKQVILGTPGVAALNTFSIQLDRVTRTLNVRFEAVTDSGHVFSSADYGPFIVEL